MNRFILVAALAVGAALIAFAVTRLRPDAAAVRTGALPSHLDRARFVAADQPWLIALFSADTCMSCAKVVEQMRGFESAQAAFQNVEVGREAELHKRYAIASVPTTLVCDGSGLVRLSFVGPLSGADRSAVAELISSAPTGE